MAYDTSRETAAFNLAMPYLIRVNSILNSNYTVFKSSDRRGFAINLRQLYRELYPWLVYDPKKGVDQITPIKEAFNKLSKVPKQNTEEIWRLMEELEMTLRMHFKQLGMLMPKVNDPRFLFGNKQR